MDVKGCCDLEKKALLRVGVGSGLWRPSKGHGEDGASLLSLQPPEIPALGFAKPFDPGSVFKFSCCV